MTRIDEAALKAAVIDRLIATRHADDNSVIVTEMTVANWSRRADVVLANGKLWGFEIKSELDSLSRLKGQVETFTKYFEKFVLVLAERFVDEMLESIPEGVGLWSADKVGNLTQKIAPKQTQLSAESYISLMTATEIKKLLTCNGLKTEKGCHRMALVNEAIKLPIKDLSSAAREAVKNRYKERYHRFLSEKESKKTIKALSFLTRTPLKIPRQTHAPPAIVEIKDIPISHDNPYLVHAPSGPILKRKVD
ncbi:sce7726 family protein [Asticcacaulis taihuensis]|uniref:sce7726 family protein n=1 Tax=Asticcacaulis taihuensis TaxID=260084 RepID=UPI00147B3F53|nr:sce7726 family protein [Asticcacaulis taihuensis]